MGSLNLPSRKLCLQLIGAAVTLVLGLTFVVAIAPGGHLTECGVDSKGPFAKIRLNGLRDRLGMSKVGLHVEFTYDGHPYDGMNNRRSTATFLRGKWPPRVINLNYDGGPRGKLPVLGRAASGHWVNKPLVEPYDKSLLGCRVIPFQAD